MDYQNFLGIYPSYDDSSFQQKIFNKKEFFDYKLSKKVEEIKPGEPLYSQLIISRFVNEHTLYDELLLYHSVGTGKTGVAFGITEKLKESKKFFRAYIFARGEDLLRQQKRQLVYMYSTRYKNLIKEQQFRPENEEKVLNKITSDFYSFRTVETFAKEISLAPDEYLLKEYSNCVFIIDEVHNLVEQGNEQTTFYKQFFRLFHLVKNKKILLMSGTPMRNEVHEIADVMNLLLPESNQMPTKNDFMDNFTVGDSLIKENKLKDYFKGRISYLRESVENIPTKYMGKYTTSPEVEQFKVYLTNMSDFQSDVYLKYYLEETAGKNMSFYSNSRQASLFVFPDRTIGNEGLETFTNKQGNLIKEFIPRVNTLQGLGVYSSKYSFIIQDILSNPKKKIYIYCSVVNGSGCNLFAKILELYGFEKLRSTTVPTKGKRYILLTSETQNIQKLLTVYNGKRNKFGEYCQVIIGSRKISEGFNFKDIQIIHVATLHWNYTETQQAVARGIRLRSHINLIEEGIVPTVKIYQHASMPSKKEDSIDLHMLDISQKKDILMKKLERVIQESAMDCPLFYERNKRDTGSGTRECNYQSCDYKCDTSGLIPSMELDLSTYNLYYQTGENVLNFLKNFFKTNFSVHIDTAQDALRIDRFQLIKTLDGLIQNNIPIINKYQVECFLREAGGVYYLVDNIAIINQGSEVGSYTSQPFFVERRTLKKLIHEKSLSVAIDTIRKISSAKTQNQVEQLLPRLTLEYREIFIERALYYSIVENKKNDLITWILDIYKDKIEIKRSSETKAISNLLEPKYRGLDSRGKWNDILKPTVLSAQTDMEIFEQNPWGYVGIIDGDNFCIRNLKIKQKLKEDKREKKTGAKCLEAGWNKDKLAALCVELKIPIANMEKIPADPRAIIMRKPSLIKLLDTTWDNMTDEELGKALYWYEQTKQNTCALIREWFSENGLLIKGPCGKTGKLKD